MKKIIRKINKFLFKEKKNNDLPKEELKNLGIAGVYLFGSQSENVAVGKLSDFDVAVLFKNPENSFGDTSEIYGKLYDIFSTFFDLSDFKNIDIVFLQNTSLQLRYHIITTGKILYNGDTEAILDHKEKTMMEYADFAPARNLFNRAILERIK